MTTAPPAPSSDRYRWVALSTVTVGSLMAFINSSIVLIALPDIFRGIKLNPLTPGNSSYLLWMMMAFMVATAVLVVSFGRIGDMFGRVRMFTAGFAVFSVGSIALSVTWMDGAHGALWMIAMRLVQGIGGALILGNSNAILTDAFPPEQRGLALGINAVSALAGSFMGLVIGGLLAPVDWRLVFLVSVPVGVFGTFWSALKLQQRTPRRHGRIDWWGNLTFAAGLVLILVAITDSLQPYGGHTMGWSNPNCWGKLVGGVVLLGIFAWVETHVAEPLFRLSLFRIRAFTAGNIATLLSALGRGGLMFMMIIWLQGIWLPQHGYSFARTPLWAGIYMLPLTVGFLIAGPASGYLSDRFGARPFATGGMLASAGTFGLLELLPVNFSYVWFAALLLLMGLSMGLFASPNQSGVMNSLPHDQRGVGAGMLATFQNSAQVLSIGVFFTLMILGLASGLPHVMQHGLVAQGIDPTTAARVSHEPPVGLLFASFLGYNPMSQLLGPAALHHVTHAQAAYITGRSFFPKLIAGPFRTGLHEAFDFAVLACLVAAGASWLRGGRFVYSEHAEPVVEGTAGMEALPSEASEPTAV